MAAAAEVQVLQLVQGQNKPFGMQNLVDLLAHQGIRKPAIQKALDMLSESGRVLAKDFGKTKIFVPVQKGLAVLSAEELEAKRAQVVTLQERLGEQRTAVKALESELSNWSSNMTEAQLAQAIVTTKAELATKAERLAPLRAGARLVTPAQRDAAVAKLSAAANAWRKRKAMFRNVWGMVSEGLDGKQASFFEEMGVETDEDVGVELSTVQALLPSGSASKRPRAALGSAAACANAARLPPAARPV